LTDDVTETRVAATVRSATDQIDAPGADVRLRADEQIVCCKDGAVASWQCAAFLQAQCIEKDARTARGAGRSQPRMRSVDQGGQVARTWRDRAPTQRCTTIS
jgi:hypothetical protein